ncbi:MAG: CD225/dispanin family protein [Kiritimatiellae bacterium]|nr:CD225/dispanin family protein [Kiritimatiellia bacterium]
MNNEDVQNHLTLAIVILVLCFPVGLAALIFALMVNAQMSKGNVIAARNYSRTAGILVKIGIALVIFEVAVAFVCVLLVGVSVVSTGSYIRQVEMESQREVEKVEREFNDMMDRIQYSNYD